MKMAPDKIKPLVCVNTDGSSDLSIYIYERWSPVTVLKLTVHVGCPIDKDPGHGDLLVIWETDRHSPMELETLVEGLYRRGGHDGRLRSLLMMNGFSKAAAKAVTPAKIVFQDPKQARIVLAYSAPEIALEVNKALYGDILVL